MGELGHDSKPGLPGALGHEGEVEKEAVKPLAMGTERLYACV